MLPLDTTSYSIANWFGLSHANQGLTPPSMADYHKVPSNKEDNMCGSILETWGSEQYRRNTRSKFHIR